MGKINFSNAKLVRENEICHVCQYCLTNLLLISLKFLVCLRYRKSKEYEPMIKSILWRTIDVQLRYQRQNHR